MNMPIPIPLQLSQSQGFAVPPVLRRALLCCVAALVGALSLWVLSTVLRADAEAGRNDARADTQKTAMQLANAREAESARVVRAKRFALVKAALENTSAEESEWEQLASQIEAHPHIVDSTMSAQPAQPAFSSHENLPVITLQSVRIEAGLLHEEALLALDAIAHGFNTHLIPTGCSLRREADAAPITLRARCEFERTVLVPSQK